MAIEFACGCGKKLKLNDIMAGKKVKCPACQSVLEVPSTVQMTGVEPNQSTGGPGKPPDKKAMTVLDEPGEGDLELDLDPAPAKKPEPAKAAKKEPAKKEPAKKEPAKEVGGYDLADDDEFDRPKTNDAKKAMTVLDGEDDFEGFELDVGTAPAPAKPAAKKPEPAKPAAPAEEPKPEPKAAMSVDVEDDDGGFKLKDDDVPPPPKPSAPESGGPSTTGPLGKGGSAKAGPGGKGPGKEPAGKDPAGKDAPAPPPAKAPDLLEQIKKLPPVALYGGAGGVALLVVVIGVLAFSGGSKPPPPPLPPPAVAKGGTTDPGNTPSMSDNGGKPEEKKKKKADVPAEPLDAETVKRLRAVSQEEAEALNACRDFWGRYEAAVKAMAEDKSPGRVKAVAEFKSLADWCTAHGLHEAARDAREFAGLLNPADEVLVRGSGRTESMVLPDKRTLFTTPAAKSRIAELGAELAVANDAYDELRVDVEGGAAGVVVPRRERKTIPVRGGRVKFKLTAAGKTAAFERTIPPGMGRQIKLIGTDRLPQLPFEAVRSAVALDAQVEAGNESPAMSRGLGETRLLRSERLPTGGRKLVLSGPMPPTFFGGPNLPPDRPTPRNAQAVRVETIKLPEGAATKVTIGERDPVEFVIRRPAPTSLSDRITSGFIRERNLLVAAADREDARVRALPEDSVTTAIAVDRQGRMQSGAVVLLGFPADTQQVCQAMGFDVDEVMLAVERHLFAPLPGGAQVGAGGDGGDLLAMVSHRPQLTWQLDSFLALCAFMGRNPDGAMYATGPLGTYEEVRWFRRQLAELFADRADPDLVAAMAPHTASVLTEVMDAATTQNFIGRPLAALLMSWRGHDAAIPPLKKLAQEYLLFRDNPARLPDPYTRALVDRWVRTMPMPTLITGALRNIGTDAAVAALIELANNQNADRETRRAAVLALAQSGRPAALAHMTGLVTGVDPALYAVVQRWIGRWDLPETRHVVDEKLKGGADGLLFLAGAIAQQERGEGNLYILRKLVQLDPLSMRDQLSRAELNNGGRQGWEWKTVPLLTGAAPSEMVRSVCWLLGRRGDLISAGLMRDYLLREVVLPRRAGEPMVDDSGEPLLDPEGKPKLHKDGDQVKLRLSRVLLESLPDARERIPLLLYPSVPPGQLWSPARHAKYGPALTLYEEAFSGFADHDAAPLVSLLTEWILSKPLVERGLRPWVLKLLAERRVAAARPLLTVMYRKKGAIGNDDTADDRCKLLAGLGLLRMADRESLKVVADESLYENLLNPLRDAFIEQYDPSYAKAPDRQRRADEFGGRLANPETGFRNSQGDNWETFVEENIWSHFRAQFASVRGDPWVFPQRVSDDPEEFLARLKRLQRDMRAAANQGPAQDDGDDAAPPPDRTVLKPGADPTVVGELLLEIVRPLDDSGLPQPVSSAFRSLRRRALSVLADLKGSDPKFTELLGEFLKGDAQKLDPQKIDLVDLAIRRFPDPGAAKVRELLIEAAGRPLEGGHRRAENRVNRNMQGSLARNYGQQLDWMTASPERLDLPLACELAARENFDILAALRGDPVFTALLVLGEIGRREKGPDRPTVKVLADIFDGKRPPENWSESFESVMDELLRRAAAAVALGIADPALAREKLTRVFTEAGWFGTDRLERLGPGAATPGQLEGARLVLVAAFRRYCVSALGAVPGVADASCGPALATGAAYATLKPPFSEDPGVNGTERAANQACLRLLLTVADKQVGAALTNMMFKVQADRLGLSPRNPMGKLVMQVVSTRCVSPAVGDRLLALLADPVADGEFRRWAFNTMVFTGDANQLRELIRYARGRDFRTTFGQVADPMRPMVLTACDPNGGLTNADAAAFLQRVLEAAADDNPGPEALMTPATIVRALRGLADNPDPAAVKALAALRELPRYRHVAALLGFRRGDRSGVAYLAAGAAAAKPEDLRRSIAALRMMPDPATPGALLDLLEQSPEPDARRLAADALYSMLLAMTAPDASVPLPEAEADKLDARVLKLLSARDTPSSLIMPLAYCTAMLAREPGLTYLAGRAATTPSVARGDVPEAAYDLHHMLACMDLIAERRRGKPGDGPAALVEGILVKRRQQKPMEDLLVAAAAELGVRCGVFAAKRETFEALLKKPGTRVSVLQALAVAGDTPEARAEGRKLLEALRDGSGMGPKAQKDETAELLNALARVEKLGGR